MCVTKSQKDSRTGVGLSASARQRHQGRPLWPMPHFATGRLAGIGDEESKGTKKEKKKNKTLCDSAAWAVT
jgi:hypothetical protein